MSHAEGCISHSSYPVEIGIPAARCSVACLVLALTIVLTGCVNTSDKCSLCDTDTDCDAPLVCSRFSDGSHRCGYGDGSTTCYTYSHVAAPEIGAIADQHEGSDSTTQEP
jgi:hypothetical protein